MKRLGSTTTFTLVCVAVLLASYGIGLGIREIRFRNAGVKTSGKTDKPIKFNRNLKKRHKTPVRRKAVSRMQLFSGKAEEAEHRMRE